MENRALRIAAAAGTLLLLTAYPLFAKVLLYCWWVGALLTLRQAIAPRGPISRDAGRALCWIAGGGALLLASPTMLMLGTVRDEADVVVVAAPTALVFFALAIATARGSRAVAAPGTARPDLGPPAARRGPVALRRGCMAAAGVVCLWVVWATIEAASLPLPTRWSRDSIVAILVSGALLLVGAPLFASGVARVVAATNHTRYLPLVLWSAAGVGIHLTGFGVWVAHEPGTLDPAGVLAVFLGPGFMLGLLLVLLGALLVKGIGLRDEEDCAASTEDTPT